MSIKLESDEQSYKWEWKATNQPLDIPLSNQMF